MVFPSKKGILDASIKGLTSKCLYSVVKYMKSPLSLLSLASGINCYAICCSCCSSSHCWWRYRASRCCRKTIATHTHTHAHCTYCVFICSNAIASSNWCLCNTDGTGYALIPALTLYLLHWFCVQRERHMQFSFDWFDFENERWTEQRHWHPHKRTHTHTEGERERQ